MKIHKEGRRPIIFATALSVLFIVPILLFLECVTICFSALLSLPFLCIIFFVARFFRVPNRVINIVDDGIISPADGTIIFIEEAIEEEYYKDNRLKISIFMSINNVHVNFFPIDGIVEYVGYHEGKYLVAKLPKSSTDNEHNTVVVRKNERDTVLFRQIAGFIARRIVSYAEVGDIAEQGKEMGIIRFGSRVDLYLPLDIQVAVKVGDKVTARKTVLAYF